DCARARRRGVRFPSRLLLNTECRASAMRGSRSDYHPARPPGSRDGIRLNQAISRAVQSVDRCLTSLNRFHPGGTMPRMSFAACLAAATALAASIAFAQPPANSGPPDLTVDAATRRSIVDTLCAKVTDRYVFPDRATAASRAIRRRFASHEY